MTNASTGGIRWSLPTKTKKILLSRLDRVFERITKNNHTDSRVKLISVNYSSVYTRGRVSASWQRER